MKILISLTYYTPHISGLTLYAQRLAEGLARRGHSVTVLTSQHLDELPLEENRNGVHVVRVPVFFRFNKGVVMRGYWRAAWRLSKEADVVNVHLPSTEALFLVLAARLRRKKVVATYHCDLRLPSFHLSGFFDFLIAFNHYVILLLCSRVVTHTEDFAVHSRLLKLFRRRLIYILPPVAVSIPDEEGLIRWQKKHQLDAGPKIGMAARFAADKGIEYLLGAIPLLTTRFPDLKVVFTGDGKAVGEGCYQRQLAPLLGKYTDRLCFLGQLNQEEMPCFYQSIDCLVVASVNSTESFGLVQVEAMLNGTPVVATNLPGVRMPVKMTGMGEIAPIRDSQALARAVEKVLNNRPQYLRPHAEIAAIFDLNKTLNDYESVFAEAAASR